MAVTGTGLDQWLQHIPFVAPPITFIAGGLVTLCCTIHHGGIHHITAGRLQKMQKIKIS